MISTSYRYDQRLLKITKKERKKQLIGIKIIYSSARFIPSRFVQCSLVTKPCPFCFLNTGLLTGPILLNMEFALCKQMPIYSVHVHATRARVSIDRIFRMFYEL